MAAAAATALFWYTINEADDIDGNSGLEQQVRWVHLCQREREREVIFRDKFVSGSRCCNDFVALNIFLFPYRLSLSVTNAVSLSFPLSLSLTTWLSKPQAAAIIKTQKDHFLCHSLTVLSLTLVSKTLMIHAATYTVPTTLAPLFFYIKRGQM